jgi:hypothetical protein
MGTRLAIKLVKNTSLGEGCTRTLVRQGLVFLKFTL